MQERLSRHSPTPKPDNHNHTRTISKSSLKRTREHNNSSCDTPKKKIKILTEKPENSEYKEARDSFRRRVVQICLSNQVLSDVKQIESPIRRLEAQVFRAGISTEESDRYIKVVIETLQRLKDYEYLS